MTQTPGGSHKALDAATRLGGNIDDALSDIHVPAVVLDRGGVRGGPPHA